MWGHGGLRDIGKGAMSLKQPEGRMGAAGACRPWPGGWAGGGALCQALAALSCFPPHPTLKRTGEPVASTVPSLLPRAPGVP